mmetsp:Transcript_1384/g.3746  ORF Transcript_1384/g.3746 Transcript_1384/m.3746 type:complete len:97 (+) Transcript_1384:1339-1629(+)
MEEQPLQVIRPSRGAAEIADCQKCQSSTEHQSDASAANTSTFCTSTAKVGIHKRVATSPSLHLDKATTHCWHSHGKRQSLNDPTAECAFDFYSMNA